MVFLFVSVDLYLLEEKVSDVAPTNVAMTKNSKGSMEFGRQKCTG